MLLTNDARAASDTSRSILMKGQGGDDRAMNDRLAIRIRTECGESVGAQFR